MCGAHRRLLTSRDRVEETLTKDGSLSALHGEAPVTSPEGVRDHEKLSKLGFLLQLAQIHHMPCISAQRERLRCLYG